MLEFPWKILISISQVLKLNDPDFPGIFLISIYPTYVMSLISQLENAKSCVTEKPFTTHIYGIFV